MLPAASLFAIRSAEIRTAVYGSDHCPVVLELDR